MADSVGVAVARNADELVMGVLLNEPTSPHRYACHLTSSEAERSRGSSPVPSVHWVDLTYH